MQNACFNYFMKQVFLFFILIFSQITLAIQGTAQTGSDSRVTYDVSGSQSTQNGNTYQEINVGLNWYLQDWLIWRNSAFQRQSQNIDSIYGVDSSFRLQKEWLNDSRTLGFKIFGGPGVRAASSDSNAYFGEAGVGLRLGGLMLGAGVKSLKYFSTRKDKTGVILPKDENQVFFTISGGGAL
jgi:hypothetical protein